MLNQEFKRARASFGDGDALKRKSHMVSGSVSDEAQTVKSLVAVVKVAKKHLLKYFRIHPARWNLETEKSSGRQADKLGTG